MRLMAAVFMHNGGVDQTADWTRVEPGQETQGWELHVSEDGRQAVVRGPAGVAVTDLSGPVLRLLAGGLHTADLKRPTERPFEWTVEVAEDTVRRAKENGRIFLRALIDEGGTATADRLREITGMEALQHATQTLSMAASKALKAKFGDEGRRWRHFFERCPHPEDRAGVRVHSYHLPEKLIPCFDEALKRVERSAAS
ncbi:hypothetical protein E1161_24450 [Saccharopolyspora aridisoli]|uniref:Uncharacterized protein n=1 Tax=Saccharopolyspora aridisoli TaxID=2530385 RepID=A0A4R4U9H1_9PSEU|nr:hypothetical protein [Saccharopolyspora aridisoli]TDC88147.1 hypothetical protein E1161_24450 [Saccharopolyspora aridisoli]